MMDRFVSLLTVTLILLLSVNTSDAAGPVNTVIHTGEGAFPLWWSSLGYGWAFIKLGYIFAGLLALFVYKNWLDEPEPAYSSYSQQKNPNTGRSNDVDLDEKIMNFGLKYN